MPNDSQSIKAQAKQDKLLNYVEASEKAGEHKRIIYGDCEVVAPVSDIEEAIALIRRSTPEANRRAMASIKAYLARHTPRANAGKASQKIAMQCAQDIAIWFANEVVEGRASLRIQ